MKDRELFTRIASRCNIMRRKAAFTDRLTNGYCASVLTIVSTPAEYTSVVSPRKK